MNPATESESSSTSSVTNSTWGWMIGINLELQQKVLASLKVIEEKDEELKRKEEELWRKEDELGRKENELRAKDNELWRKEGELHRKENELMTKDEVIRKLSDQLSHWEKVGREKGYTVDIYDGAVSLYHSENLERSGADADAAVVTAGDVKTSLELLPTPQLSQEFSLKDVKKEIEAEDMGKDQLENSYLTVDDIKREFFGDGDGDDFLPTATKSLLMQVSRTTSAQEPDLYTNFLPLTLGDVVSSGICANENNSPSMDQSQPPCTLKTEEGTVHSTLSFQGTGTRCFVDLFQPPTYDHLAEVPKIPTAALKEKRKRRKKISDNPGNHLPVSEAAGTVSLKPEISEKVKGSPKLKKLSMPVTRQKRASRSSGRISQPSVTVNGTSSGSEVELPKDQGVLSTISCSEVAEIETPHGVDNCKHLFCLCGSGQYQDLHGLKKHILYYKRERKCRCDVCEKRFVFPCQLALHVGRSHPDHASSIVEQPRSCFRCKTTFLNTKEYLLHRKIAHNTSTSSKRQDLDEIVEVDRNGIEHGFASLYPKILSSDLGIDSDGSIYETQYTCKCGKNYSKRSALRSHLKLVIVAANSKTFQCTECSKNFRSKISMKAHVKNFHKCKNLLIG